MKYLELRVAGELTEILETDWDTMQWTLELFFRGEVNIKLSSRFQRV